MISTHCGQRLKKYRSHNEGYRRGAHAWLCGVCGRIFVQAIRRANDAKLAWIRPDSRNAAADYQIPADEAKRLYEEGKLARDLTNGGYCPIWT